jgi:hypothetical protein
MNPRKAFMSGHKFFCNDSVQAFVDYMDNHPELNLVSWKKMIEIIEAGGCYKITKESENWLKRAKRAMDHCDLVELGGDLKPTEEYRVVRGQVLVQGSKEKCLNFLKGGNLKFLKDSLEVSQSSSWDAVVDEEGRVATSVESLLEYCLLERKYYDEVDDIVFWKNA